MTKETRYEENTKRVLVIDDESFNCKAVVDMMSILKFEAVE